MAGRGRGKIWSSSQLSITKSEKVDPLSVYTKMLKQFPDICPSNSIEKWIKDIFTDVVMDPQIAIDVSKYMLLFTKYNDTNIGVQVRKHFLRELEASYNDYAKADDIGDPVKYRNFTYFFAASLYYMREPNQFPLKVLMSALLILISKLDMENIEDSIVYAKSITWLSSFITDEMDGSVLSNAYKEALNKLRELFSTGKGSLISLACLEASINRGVLTQSGKEFYSTSLPKSDYIAVNNDFSLVLPAEDEYKFILSSFNNVVFV